MMFDLKLLFVVVLSLLPLLACTQFLKYQNIVPMHNTHILTQLEDLKYQQIIDTFPRNNSEHCVISFTLYGNDKKYTLGALRNAVIAPLYYPGWKVRFYVSDYVDKTIVRQLINAGPHVEIANYSQQEQAYGSKFGMIHRFTVAADTTVDRYIVRDVDSRLNYRERFAVEEWIQSGKSIHIMRDHPYHTAAVMGGMWGGVKGALPDMEGEIARWKDKVCDVYACDMTFLRDIYWERFMQHNSMMHDSYHCKLFPSTSSSSNKRSNKSQQKILASQSSITVTKEIDGKGSISRPFPTPRNRLFEHIGQVFDYREVPYHESVVEHAVEQRCNRGDH